MKRINCIYNYGYLLFFFLPPIEYNFQQRQQLLLTLYTGETCAKIGAHGYVAPIDCYPYATLVYDQTLGRHVWQYFHLATPYPVHHISIVSEHSKSSALAVEMSDQSGKQYRFIPFYLPNDYWDETVNSWR